MIPDASGALRAGGGTVRASALRRLCSRGRVPATVTIAGPGDAATTVRTATTSAGFGGRRPWFICPCCQKRTSVLHVASPGPACRSCATLPYESRRGCGAPWWRLWGRAVHQLARVRAELARRYLRLARRGELERLEARLADEVCHGLAADQTAALEWETKAGYGAWFGVPPFGLGYDWDDEAGGVVPIV